MADADEHGAAAVGSDGTAAAAAAADTISGSSLPVHATEKYNLSVASTPTHSSSKAKSSIAVGSSGMSRVTFPASPALSTLSKNTSSSGTSSFASAAKMSVDDILSSSKLSLGARQKAMRKIVQKSSSAVKVEYGKQNATTTVSSGGVSPQQSIRPKHITSSSTPIANTLKIQRPRQNPGQEDRKKRLERLQKDLLQRQLSELAKIKQQDPHQNNSVDTDTNYSEDETSKQSSVSSKKRKGSLLVDEVPSNTDTRNLETTSSLPSKSTTDSPASRRPKRVKAVASYKASDSTKNSMIPEFKPSPASPKSLPPSVVKPSKSTTTSDNMGGAMDETINTNVESQSAQSIASLQTPLNTDIADEPDEIDEPESAQLALAALLAKYDSFIETQTKSNIEGGEKSNSGKGSSPWAIVQSLLSCLSHISLFDPDFLNSEECRQVEIGLARIFKSSNRVRWEVMNRSSQSSDDEEILAAKEAHLIQLIQVQVWMRMMVWSFEREAGWEFLLRVIALADAAWDRQVEGNGTSKEGKKKKKGKKDERKHPKQPKHESASEGLVHDLRQLMELAPYVLPASLNFSQWLKDTLTFGFRQPIPDYGAQLFDHFEIEVNEPIALKRSGTDNSRQSEKSEVSHSPVKSQNGNGNPNPVNGESPTKQLMEKRQKSQQAYFASLAEEEKSASNGADDESATATGSFSTVTSFSRSSSTICDRVDPLLLKTSVSLTSAAPAQTSNPFLKGSARGVYVGSHLGSKLSNITSLFREVKAPAKPIVEKKVKATKQLDITSSSAASSGGVSAPSGLNKRKDVGSAKTQLSSSTPNETPFKRPRPAYNPSRVSRAPLFAIEETPIRPIIDETPAKKSNPTARTRLRLRDELPLVGNSIIAETPQQQPMHRSGPSGLPWRSQGAHRQPPPSPYVGNSIITETPQQQPMRRGGAAPSSVLPTNLWHRHDMQRPLPPPPPRQPFRQSNHPSQGSQGLMQAGRNDNGQHHHLSPINHPRPGASAPLNFGLSPMPNQEDMAQVMAKVAKSAARKEGMK